MAITAFACLCNSLVQSYFDYCSPLWDTCGKQLKDKLQKFKAVRVGSLTVLQMTLDR